MDATVSKAGNSGPKIRSDCEVELELRESGGIEINLVSRVYSLYGESIKKDCENILNFFGVGNAVLRINDSGALPFVLHARIESAVKKLTDTKLEFLPEFNEENKYSTERNRFRFTRLYLPGNTPSLMINAGLHSPDGIILDLEDSVAPEKKDEARILVRNALRQINFYWAERMVRINQGEAGLNDLKYVIPHYVNLVLIPKCEYPEEVQSVEEEISRLCDEYNIPVPVYLMPIIESARGV
ncbi:MAG: citrate lyase ACP, partial [Bacteroidales bacterium]|nr:citrate lyase ACP [Bacteroidales bacterium]